MAKKIKAAVIGVGNCFAGLVEGIQYYKEHPEAEKIGLMHDVIEGYSIYDIEWVAAYDVGKYKVGKPLRNAIYSEPNMVKWVKEVEGLDVEVRPSPVLDGVGSYVKEMFQPVDAFNGKPLDEVKTLIVDEIKASGANIIVNYLPVGSEKASKFWAEVALESGAAFVNNIPTFIASDPVWASKFKDKGLPIIGDDIKSQVGATIVHRILTWLVTKRGAVIDRTYQLNFGGNTDFANMLERSRLKSKKISKTEAVQSQMKEILDARDIHIGPSDYVPFLGNEKIAYIRIEGRMFADVPFNMELRLDVDDKANSGGTSIEAIRLAQLALDRGIGGPIYSASAYLMKHPPQQMSDAEAAAAVEAFIRGERDN